MTELSAGGRLPSVSVVIPTRDGRSRLERSLAPLLSDPATTEVVVVVDGSTDGSLDFLARQASSDPRIRPVFVDSVGPSAARQAGVEAATGEVVLMLDDDLVAEPLLVTGHARHHAAEHSAVVVGYYSDPDPLEAPRTRGAFATEIYADAYRSSWESYADDAEQVLIHLWGGNVSLRRADCMRVGVHSDAFYCRYHEDQDFGIRCLAAGLHGITDPALRARHLRERSVNGFIKDARDDGAGTMLVHVLHPDVVGAPDIARFSEGLPLSARLLVQLSRRRAIEVLTTAVLIASVNVAGRLRQFDLETSLARLLRRIQQQRGALETLRRYRRQSI